MAKKETKTKVEVQKPQVKQPQPEIIKPKVEKKTRSEDNWEIKDRTYFLKGKKKPLSRMIRSANIYWFDENKGHERELKYCENQTTSFVDEMKGDQRLSHIIFRNGALMVTREKTVLQKLLSLYHPDKDIAYEEWKPTVQAASDVDYLEMEIEALNAAQKLDINMAEAVLRVEVGSAVSNMSSKELKRDILLFARRKPGLFLDLLEDENVHLRNIGIRATEMGVLNLSKDQRTFHWGSNDRKLMTVPFDEHPYSALAAWFRTDEGMEVLKSIEKRLK
tara:strand:+ start:26 stop:856 length:831 start_codon:yes stop_codon:yes gene_type:complete